MTKIDRLSAEALARLPDIREEWFNIALSTQPADRHRAEQGVALAYSAIGRPPPRTIYWVDSPLQGVLMLEELRKKHFFSSREKAIKCRIEQAVLDHFYPRISEGYSHRIRDLISGQVRESLKNSLSFSMGSLLSRAIKEKAGKPLAHAFGMPQDAHWLGYYDAFPKLALPEGDPLGGLAEIANSCGWCWFFFDMAILTERPETLSLDSNYRLHSSDGPAITYPDGFSLYAWHGYPIDKNIFDNKKKLTPQQILDEKNTELRRIKMEIFLEYNDADTIIGVFKAKIIDSAPCLGLERQLLKIGKDRYLYCTNGSVEPDGKRRKFLLGVPSESLWDWSTMRKMKPITSAHNASAWTYGIDPKKYQEQVRT